MPVSQKTGGYAHPAYSAALSEFGVPRALPRSGGHVLVRRIPDTPYHDAMGPYPLFACRDWSRLPEDLETVGEDLVSLVLVADPLGNHDDKLLDRCFDVVRPFKEHFVTDLGVPKYAAVSKHHRYYARKALAEVRVEECEEPMRFLDEWAALYANLAERNVLDELRAFSKESFAKQLEVPGMVMFRAVAGEETVGMHLWYVSREVAYSHLAASSGRGYELMAAYALHWFALGRFAGRLAWLDLGAGAGIGEDSGGLSRFKKGWSTETRTAYLCGRTFDREKYTGLSRRNGLTETGYFPAYRAGEFG